MLFSKTEKAYAKLNLTLDVTARRADGYHDLCMVMQTVDLYDTITLQETGDGTLHIQTDVSHVPGDQKNLAAVAAKYYFEAAHLPFPGFHIQIQKRIPVCAGMGGGSSDGAAVLRMLNEAYCALSQRELERIGESVGSDVPYCLYGGTMLAEGKGECLRSLPKLPDCFLVICKPKFSISTPVLFSRIHVEKIRCRPDTAGVLSALQAGDLEGVSRRLYNVFETVLDPKRQEELVQIRTVMVDSGALGVSMSGTGPTMFGIFTKQAEARTAYEILKQQYPDSFLTHPV